MAIQIKHIPLLGKYYNTILTMLFKYVFKEAQMVKHLDGKFPGELTLICLPGDGMVKFKFADIEIKIGTKYSLDYFMVEKKNINDHNYYFLVNAGEVYRMTILHYNEDYYDSMGVNNQRYYEILHWLMYKIVELFPEMKNGDLNLIK